MRTRQKRAIRRYALLLGLCIAISLAAQYVISPFTADDGRPFDLERELKSLPADQRDAAREKWESLSETERERVRSAAGNLTTKAKQEILERLK